jgi:hypothetical protein
LQPPRITARSFVVVSVRSNVGALLDAVVSVRLGHNPMHWVTASPAEARPNSPLRFRIDLSGPEHSRVLKAMGDQKVPSAVTGVRFITPGQSRFVSTKAQDFVVAR